MRKPILFECRIFIPFFRVDGDWDRKYKLLSELCDQYGFTDDNICGEKFCFTNYTVYESLESRILFFSKRLKEAGFEVLRCIIKAIVYDSIIHEEIK